MNDLLIGLVIALALAGLVFTPPKPASNGKPTPTAISITSIIGTVLFMLTMMATVSFCRKNAPVAIR